MKKPEGTRKGVGKSLAKGTTRKPKRASLSVEDLLQFVTGGIHAISPVSVQPRIEMWRWRLYQVKSHGFRSRHLVGLADGEGRVCSGIVQWDLKNLCATTVSGRVYLLVGPPGWNADADYVFEGWKAVNGCEQVKDMTRALLRLRAIRGISGDPGRQRVNEKFGAVRFYFRLGMVRNPLRVNVMTTGGVASLRLARPLTVDGPDMELVDRISALTDAAESKTRDMCLVCGKPGTFDRTAGYLLNLCEAHAKRPREGTGEKESP